MGRKASGNPEVVPVERIAGCIYLIRGQKVMLDADLAVLYGVETRAFNQAVKRNPDRFPEDFMFRLTSEETASLRSQNVISSWGGRRHPPYALPNRASRCFRRCCGDNARRALT